MKYSPDWKGAGYTRMRVEEEEWLKYGMKPEQIISYDESIPFTIESWTGRIRACRGIGASLDEERIQEFDREHMQLLKKHVPDEVRILHHILIVTYTMES